MKKKIKDRNINIPKIIWVSGIFIILILILIMVIIYKVNYEYLDKNYLYFYNCNDDVCVSYVKDKISDSDLYSEYECGYEKCPSISKTLSEGYVVLLKDDLYYLYNYIDNKIITSDYQDYILINTNNFIVKKDSSYGLIDDKGKEIIEPIYDELGYTKDNELLGYSIKSIIVKKDKQYGIVSIKDGSIEENIKYEEKDIETLLKIINS